jgi:hypothetical protein
MTVRDFEDSKIEFYAEKAMKAAIEARIWLAKAKNQRIHSLALSADRMAAFYEGQCMGYSRRMMGLLESQRSY